MATVIFPTNGWGLVVSSLGSRKIKTGWSECKNHSSLFFTLPMIGNRIRYVGQWDSVTTFTIFLFLFFASFEKNFLLQFRLWKQNNIFCLRRIELFTEKWKIKKPEKNKSTFSKLLTKSTQILRNTERKENQKCATLKNLKTFFSIQQIFIFLLSKKL